MSAEVNPSVEEETLQPVAQATESEVVQEERQESPQEKKRRNDAEYNWAEARRKMQELERQNQELKQQFERSTAKQPKEEPDELDKLADDDIVTKAQVKRMAAKMAEEIANKVVLQREAATVEDRLQVKYQDFNEIVTKENIELLKQTEPELADSLRYIPDPYAQGVAAYKMMKKIGLKQEQPEPVEKKRALENSQKPLSSQAVSRTSALADVNQFAELSAKGKQDFLRQKYEEMQSAIKRG